MNSSGWIRAIMASNYDEEKFLLHVADIIDKEFESEVMVIEFIKDNYMVNMHEYSLIINKMEIEGLKGLIGPYRLDKYILDMFMEQVFKFELNRSQYIRNLYLGEINE